jgi:hypothetical protein
VSDFRLPVAFHRWSRRETTLGVLRVANDGEGQASEVDLFDEDVDVGEEAPEGEDFTEEELEGIRASQADPETPAADAEVS